jgi:ketosteroid isomerase-like protein
MQDNQDLEARIRRLEDREELHELVVRYGQLVDDRDLDGLAELYTQDAIFDSREGPITGRTAVLDYYRRQLRSYGVTYHFVHGHVVDELRDDVAHGVAHSHAELEIGGAAFVVALRYSDQYRREDGRWRFHHRAAQQLYALPLSELPHRLGEEHRKHWPGTAARLADIPESLPSWQRFWSS